MKIAHTPAPWNIRNSRPSAVEIVKTWDKVGTDVICTMAWVGSVRANAQLIAAAPELLEALKAIAAICEDEDRFPYHTEKAAKAIAKATQGLTKGV